MNVTWMITGIGTCAAMASMLRWLRWHDRQCELGNVSDRWVAEHRVSSMGREP
jgi:hypothetical protein